MDHEGFDGREDLHDRVIHAGREATELTRPDQDPLAFYLNEQRAM
jgi:hypothetical protein